MTRKFHEATYFFLLLLFLLLKQTKQTNGVTEPRFMLNDIDTKKKVAVHRYLAGDVSCFVFMYVAFFLFTRMNNLFCLVFPKRTPEGFLIETCTENVNVKCENLLNESVYFSEIPATFLGQIYAMFNLSKV